MEIKKLRQLDYWLGRIICWWLTILFSLKKLFIKKGGINKKINKILFIKLFGLGSIVLAIPSIRAVRDKYPDASIYFLSFKENEELLELINIIPSQNIFTVRKDKFINFLLDSVHCFYCLAKEKVDVVIDLEFFSRFTAIVSFLVRAKFRIGFLGFHTEGLKRGNFLDFPVNYNHTIHTSRAFFTLLKPLGLSQETFPNSIPNIQEPDGLQEIVYSLIRNENINCPLKSIGTWVVINPNTSDLINLRKWPIEHYVSLITQLLFNYKSLGIIIIGNTNDRALTTALMQDLRAEGKETRVVNLAGKTSIHELLNVLQFADLFITNDSGPAHLASLTNIPSIVLFGPETPALYSPIGKNVKTVYLGLDCQPCISVYNGKLSHCKNNICLQRIKPELIISMAKDSLGRSQKKR